MGSIEGMACAESMMWRERAMTAESALAAIQSGRYTRSGSVDAQSER